MKKIYFTLLGFLIAAGNLLQAQCIIVNSCPNTTIDVCDLTPNDALLWNETYWNDPVLNIHDLPEGPADLSITASSNCGGTLSIQYELWLDLDGNGTQETVVGSAAAPNPGEVMFNNAGGGGTVRNFDERPVTTDQKYRFALQLSANGNDYTAQLRWNTISAPNAFSIPELPYGVHKIKWLLDDGQGNTQSCEYNFVVKDCKKPTVVCINGLSVNILPTGMITIWASDFLQYAEDNSTPGSQIKFGIRKAGTGTGFPVDGNGDPLLSVTYNCLELGLQVVELWVIDKAGNADYCETSVTVADFNFNCGSMDDITLTVCERLWCDDTPVAGVGMNISGTGPNGPFNLIPNLGSNGCFTQNIPYGSNFTVTPSLESDPLNGIDVFDLIAISKHILGLAPLPSPYAMIAADANKSNSITSFDIVELRKLIIGIYGELPNNTSWRFVDSSFVFPNPINPFQTQFPQTASYSNLPQFSDVHVSFYAIKIGDINCSAIPGMKQENGDDRAPSTALTMPDWYLEAGEMRDVPVQFAQTETLSGLQFGLQFDPAFFSVEMVQTGDLQGFDAADCIARPAPGRINGIWFDANPLTVNPFNKIVTLRVRALRAGYLRDAFGLTQGGGNTLRSIACTDRNERKQLQLEFRTVLQPANASSVGKAQPNPTDAGSAVSLQLTKADQVKVQISDLSGKILYEQRLSLSEGTHLLEMPATAFPKAGVYLWRVETSEIRQAGRLVRM